jgi:hypothetical protein
MLEICTSWPGLLSQPVWQSLIPCSSSHVTLLHETSVWLPLWVRSYWSAAGTWEEAPPPTPSRDPPTSRWCTWPEAADVIRAKGDSFRACTNPAPTSLSSLGSGKIGEDCDRDFLRHTRPGYGLIGEVP